MHTPAIEVIKPFVSQHPEHKFATTESELGVWLESESRYYPFARLSLTGQWVFTPFDYLVNGQRIERHWVAV